MRKLKYRILLEDKQNPSKSQITIYAELYNGINGLLQYPIDLNKWKIINIDEYTQLNDNENNEIYERDLIETNDGRIWEVYWDNESAAFMLDYKNMSGNIFLYEVRHNIKIVKQ